MQYLVKQNTGNIQKAEGVNPFLLDILNRRGVKDVEEFLHPSFDALHDPFLLNCMNKLVDMIKISKGRQVIIYACRDIDGAFAAAILYMGLRKVTKTISIYFSDKPGDKYGVSKKFMDVAKENTPSAFIITIGCGANSKNELALCNDAMDAAVIDYHSFSDGPGCLMVNPCACDYPFKDLCATTLAFKLMQALFGMKPASQFLDIAAVASLASEIPLIKENRVITAKGIEFMNNVKAPWVRALTKQFHVEKISAEDISSRYIPLFKACVKAGNINDIVRFLITPNITEAENIVASFAELYKNLKAAEDNIFIQSLNTLGDFDGKAVVLSDNGWLFAALENTAIKLMKKFLRPCVLFINNGNGALFGVCASQGVITEKILKECKSVYHAADNGRCTNICVKEADFGMFKKEFEALCSSATYNGTDEKIYCDLELKMSDINRKLYDALEQIQPCGYGNPAVKIKLIDISLKNVIIRAGKHFSASIFDETGICEAICFNSAVPQKLDNIDMVVSVGLNTYRGKEKIKCNILSLMQNGKNLKKPPVSLVTNYGVRVIDQPIEVLGLNDRKIKQFTGAGIDTLQKLVNYFPTKYNDFRYTKVCKDVVFPETGSIIGRVTRVNVTPKIAYAMCVDENGEMFMACWFHQDYVARLLTKGYDYIFCGKISRSDRGMVQVFPMYFSTNIAKYKAIIPEYKKIPGMSAEYLIQSIDKALQMTPNTDFLDINIVDKFGILSDYDATVKLHHPANDFEIRDGQRRKVFNELFEFNFILKSRNKENVTSKYLLKKRDKLEELKKLLPYELTNDQDNCINGIYSYMNSGKILNALVQGDVGSGKTMVALFSMLLAINNGYQACLIAPTEVLAQQHFTEISGYLEQLGYKTGYLVGGMKARERKALLAGLKSGEINAVVGTHAVIQKDVAFSELAVVIIDEQHKFGVAQREKLANIEGPHMISMSATPIPRTLSMATYGDNIQVYSIKQKPAGRKDVVTLKMYSDDEVNQFMLEQIRQGRQCYVVCPMIEDNDVEAMAGVRSVKQEAQAMIEWFKRYPEVKVSNATGRMKKELIAEEIDKFTRNETNILISTTIIEVGVNVPNATVMVLKSSERFGLAQAHQLRGRVGRGNFQSYCILQTDIDDEKADILCETTDGFEIARQDLLLRGSGDYIGTQQTGNNRNVMLMMSEPELYKGISETNDEIYKNPALFAKYSYILDKVKDPEEKI